MASKAQFDALAAQINADIDALSPPSSGPQEFVYNLPSGYQVTINDTGIASVKIGGATIANGGNHLFDGRWFYGLIPFGDLFSIPRTSKSISGLTNPVVTHSYAGHISGQVTWVYTVSGDDIRIDTTVKNLGSNVMDITAIGGPGFLFDNWADKTSNFFGYDASHLMANGPTLCYPSSNIGIAGAYLSSRAAGAAFNLAIWPDSIDDQYMLIGNGAPALTGISLTLLFLKPIEPGQSRTFKYTCRFSNSMDWRILLGGYKDTVRAQGLPLKYIPDARPVSQFTAIDQSYIRPNNPYGYNDNNGTTPWRRLDLGAQGFVDKVLPGLLTANYQGIIFWQPQGIHPRGVQYRPDFNVFNPQTLANLPTLTGGFRNAGKSVGLLARPAVTVTSGTWTTDSLAQTNPGPVGMIELNARFDWAISKGFNSWYLDSFITTPQDHIILESIRDHLGTNIQTYVEFCSVADMSLSGVYGELSYANGQFQFTPRQEILRWLFPESTWIMKAPAFPSETPAQFAELFEFMLSHRVTPIVDDYLTSWTGTTDSLAPLVAQYIDSNNQWIN